MQNDSSKTKTTALSAALEVELRAEIAAVQARISGLSDRYWLGVRDAYQTVLTSILPTAKAEAESNAKQS